MIYRVGKKLSSNMFLNEKSVDLFLSITDGPLNAVCKQVGSNYSHAIKLLNIWVEMGLLVKNKSGYRYNLFYTARGKLLCDHLNKIKAYMKRSQVQWAVQEE